MEAIKGSKDAKAKDDKPKDAKGTVDKTKMVVAPEKPKPKEVAKAWQKKQRLYNDKCFGRDDLLFVPSVCSTNHISKSIGNRDLILVSFQGVYQGIFKEDFKNRTIKIMHSGAFTGEENHMFKLFDY